MSNRRRRGSPAKQLKFDPRFTDVLQYIIYQKCVPVELLEYFYHQNAHINDISFQDGLEVMNKEIERHGLKIFKTIDELTGVPHYALVYLGAMADIKLISGSTEEENDFLSNVANFIITSEFGVRGSLSLLRLGSNSDYMVKPINPDVANDMLNRFTSKKLLISPFRGYYALSPLMLLWMEPYFKDFPEGIIKTCILCNKTACFALKCDNCQGKVHFHCLSKYKDRIQQTRCISCKSNWQIHEFNEPFFNIDGMSGPKPDPP